MSTTRLLVVHARSPLHAGTGQATAAVDLPIARDRATAYPLLPGSSIKGSLRARARDTLKDDETIVVFGPETENASDHAGSLAFTDARLLLLPVRSVAGTFAWVTSPYILASFAREALLAGITTLPKDAPAVPSKEAWVTTGTLLGVDIDKGPAKGLKVVLEEFDLERKVRADDWGTALAPLVFQDLAWQELLKQRLCIVHDDTMSFLSLHATEVVTRVSINPDTGTAKKGQLWTEENLPAETVLVSLVEEVPTGTRRTVPAGSYLDRVQAKLLSTPIQLGGKATVGRGRCALRLVQGGN